MRSRQLLPMFVVFLLTTATQLAQSAPLLTLEDERLFFPASELLTNDISGLTGNPTNWMITSVSPSGIGSKVALVTTQSWAQTYLGPAGGNDYPGKMIVDHAGNVIVVGSSEGDGTGQDILLLKYSAEG